MYLSYSIRRETRMFSVTRFSCSRLKQLGLGSKAHANDVCRTTGTYFDARFPIYVISLISQLRRMDFRLPSPPLLSFQRRCENSLYGLGVLSFISPRHIQNFALKPVFPFSKVHQHPNPFNSRCEISLYGSEGASRFERSPSIIRPFS